MSEWWEAAPTVQQFSQEMRAAPPTQQRPVADTLDRSASFGTSLRAGMAPADDDKIRRYAAARFPNTPIDEAVNRYGIINGEIVYADPSGNYVREVPSMNAPGSSIPDRVMRAGRYVASQFFPAAPQVAAGVAGLATADPLVAGVVAGGADQLRQLADKALAGEDMMPTGSGLLNSAGQAAEAAGGQAVGRGVAKMFDRNPLQVGRYDRDAAMSGQVQQRADDLTVKAQREGIPLTAGERTDLPSLKAMERQLRDKPETADTFGQFYDKRVSENIPTALDRYKAQLSPKGTMAEQTSAVRSGAEAVIGGAVKARKDAAGPYYKKAFASGATIDQTPFVDALTTRLATAKGEMQRVLSEAKGYLDTGKPMGIREAHDAKIAIDALIDGRGEKAISTSTKNELTQLKKGLVKSMRNASPDYEVGRSTFEKMSPDVAELVDGVVGGLAKEGPGGVDTLANSRWIFDPSRSTPEAVAKARQAFEGAGQGDAWKALVRSHIDDAFSKANVVNANGEKGNVPGKFFKSTFGDTRSQEILKAATDPNFYNRYKDFMDVMQAASRSEGQGSRTARDLGADPKMPDTVSGVANFFGKALSPQTYTNLPDRVAQGIVEMRDPGARQKLAEALLDPEASKELRRLRILSPGSRKAMQIVSQFLTVAGIGAAAPEPADRAPFASE